MVPLSHNPLDANQPCCPECRDLETVPEESGKDATGKVVKLLEEMAANDDIAVAENILSKQLHLRKDFGCASRKYAKLWITAAVDLGLIRRVKHEKPIKICRSSRHQQTMKAYPRESLDTSTQIQAIANFLRTTIGWGDRKDVIRLLEEICPQSMSHPYYRLKVLFDGQTKKKLFLGRCAYGQVVALTEHDMYFGLKFVETSTLNTVTRNASMSSTAYSTMDDRPADVTDHDSKDGDNSSSSASLSSS
jgi:hypothetical protein